MKHIKNEIVFLFVNHFVGKMSLKVYSFLAVTFALSIAFHIVAYGHNGFLKWLLGFFNPLLIMLDTYSVVDAMASMQNVRNVIQCLIVTHAFLFVEFLLLCYEIEEYILQAVSFLSIPIIVASYIVLCRTLLQQKEKTN